MNIKELKSILKENNINFYTYWDKKKKVNTIYYQRQRLIRKKVKMLIMID